uniref:Uncharacterized protein n=1 Tax=Heterorhabditis bacteriophora TaxID=37862 RepID=A0A1I7W9Z8_HETBA
MDFYLLMRLFLHKSVTIADIALWTIIASHKDVYAEVLTIFPKIFTINFIIYNSIIQIFSSLSMIFFSDSFAKKRHWSASFSCICDKFSSNAFKTSVFNVRGFPKRCRSLTSKSPTLKLLWEITPSPSTEHIDLYASAAFFPCWNRKYSFEYAAFIGSSCSNYFVRLLEIYLVLKKRLKLLLYIYEKEIFYFSVLCVSSLFCNVIRPLLYLFYVNYICFIEYEGKFVSCISYERHLTVNSLCVLMILILLRRTRYEIDSCYSCFSVLTKILSGDSVIPELGAKFVALIIFDIRGTYRSGFTEHFASGNVY